KPLYFFAEKNDIIQGVLPLFQMFIPIIMNQLIGLPFCDVGHVLANSEEIRNQLIKTALEQGKKLGVKTLEIRGRHGLAADNFNLPVTYISEKVSMILDLPKSSEDLWAGFKSKLRSQIRKAHKNGLTFEFSTKVTDFYSVFSENMRDLGSPVHSKKWIESVMNNYGNKARMGLVYLDQLPVGGGIILTAGKKISIPWASTLQQYNRLGPNMLLYWNFLKFSADHGYSLFDFGRSTPNEGTYRFKAQWGAKPVALEWHMIYLDGTLPAQKKETSKNRERIAHIWQKLPLSLANFTGPILRKYISL
ncbi:MAG: GNAT family N-acetyltransferase, partial [Candidatus Cloacimonadota bacterium]|nr:GNAT family N-acetyltransferase [Candidatus Cloacimonadota bacterium]